ncbi:MAG: hypothetical protein KA254_01805 [Rhodoferax sp.]|nr:hypothetical protein [Rhodoferax sp.]
MKIFEIFADGHKVGITVAPNVESALVSAYSATTRHTESKMDVSCDFGGLVARLLQDTACEMYALQPKLPTEKMPQAPGL